MTAAAREDSVAAVHTGDDGPTVPGDGHVRAARHSWLHSDRFLARNVARPLRRFMEVEAAGGVILVAATIVALVWANSPWSGSYEAFWSTEIALDVGGRSVAHDLRHWVNDGAMVLFFFVAGLEIKQELVAGHLADRRAALLPVVAALGGMIVPALVYTGFNGGGAGASGWGIPMATDIAFAVGVLTLLGDRIPGGLKVLLLAIAIADDIGAIAIIAIFYTEAIEPGWAVAALCGLALVAVMARIKVRYTPVYVIVGAFVWFATFNSGIHATIAGVALGLLAPAVPLMSERRADAIADELAYDGHVTADEVREASFRLRESVAVAERLGAHLHPWTSYVVVPLFALANTGVEVSGRLVADALHSPVTVGVTLGLVLGKAAGISLAVALAVRCRVAVLPAGTSGPQILGIAALGGIGFTVSVFIAGLAFDDPVRADHAKIGILAASVLAAALGSVILRRATVAVRAGDGAPGG